MYFQYTKTQSKRLHAKREAWGYSMKDQTKGRPKPRMVSTEPSSSIPGIWDPYSMIYVPLPLQFC